MVLVPEHAVGQMKIAFFVPYHTHYDSTTVRRLPSGGTERATVFLAEALTRLGHEAIVLTSWGALDQAPIADADAVISPFAEIFGRAGPSTVRVWWPHQYTDRPFVHEQAKHARRHADEVVTLSAFHRDDLQRRLGIESTIIGHGVWLDEVVTDVEKVPGRLVFCSVPQRGLDMVTELFPCIRHEIPEATLAVCSSLRTWGADYDDRVYEPLYDRLRHMPGVSYLGALGQRELWTELARAEVFFYPATYRETYCMALDEALAHGCVPVVTEIGALPERWPATARPDRAAIAELRRWRRRRPILPTPPDWMVVAEKWTRLLEGG